MHRQHGRAPRVSLSDISCRCRVSTHLSGPPVGSTCRVHLSGPPVGSTCRVHLSGPPVGSHLRVDGEDFLFSGQVPALAGRRVRLAQAWALRAALARRARPTPARRTPENRAGMTEGE